MDQGQLLSPNEFSFSTFQYLLSGKMIGHTRKSHLIVTRYEVTLNPRDISKKGG